MSVEESVSRGKRHRDLNVVESLKHRQNLHSRSFEENSHFRKDFPKLKQKWRSEIVKSEIRFLLFMRLIKNSNLNDYSYSDQCSDPAQREKINLCGELERRNGLFRENRAKDCQEIEELRRICCE